MFILGMMSVFIGITLLAPDEAKGMLLIVIIATKNEVQKIESFL